MLNFPLQIKRKFENQFIPAQACLMLMPLRQQPHADAIPPTTLPLLQITN